MTGEAQQLDAHDRPDPPAARATLHGSIRRIDSDDAVRRAVDDAFTYRGDVSLLLEDDTVVTGYVFDRRSADSPAESVVRLIPTQWKADPSKQLTFRYDQVKAVKFTGRDAAEGKTWEAWLAKQRDGEHVNPESVSGAE
ncbi:MAG: hypothetical protein KAS72_01775 [Phycisphaerales bacterium]|nr:hypothetical protein [Phycisphaerales bacterium]